jgi:hypothetical protein
MYDTVRERESDRAKIKRLERENRVFREREQDFEERYQGPADIEGVGGHPAVIILRDKNMGEVKRIIDDLPNIPGLRPGNDPTAEPLGFRRACGYVRSEVAKYVDSVIVIGSHNTALVRDRHRLKMWIRNRAGKLLRPDIIGEQTRADLQSIIEDVAFAPSVSHLFGLSQETEVQQVEAERKGFG